MARPRATRPQRQETIPDKVKKLSLTPCYWTAKNDRMMTCERYHYRHLGIEWWAFSWGPLPGGDSVHCLAALLHMFGTHQARGQA